MQGVVEAMASMQAEFQMERQRLVEQCSQMKYANEELLRLKSEEFRQGQDQVAALKNQVLGLQSKVQQKETGETRYDSRGMRKQSREWQM